MSPKHGPSRAEVRFTPLAAAQARKFEIAELIAADRATVALSINPWIGELKGGRVPVREYREPGTEVRVIYTTSTRGALVMVNYIEA